VKVLLGADAVGGVFTYAAELARALAARGVAVVLATEGARLDAGQRAELAGVPGLVHEESAFALEWMESPWADVEAAGAWLLAIERRERPDVVHVNAYAHGALPFRAPVVVGAHSCVPSWFEAVRGEPAPAAWDRYRRVVGEGLRGADLVVAPSAHMADLVVRHHGPLPRPVVIANGRDPARFPPGEKEPLVLGAGRLWDEAKNAAALVRVAPELPWPVFVAGETAAPGAARAEAEAGAATERVHSERRGAAPRAEPEGSGSAAALPPGHRPATFLGRLPQAELARWLGRAAVFAHPARYEPFGLAVLEAALAGCALVLGDVPSLRERWDGAAAFVGPGDDRALAGALAELASDAPRRAALAGRARGRALELSPGAMADATLGLYRTLAARGRAPGRRGGRGGAT
jgi:glycosyltransferase involved in cell wall biosynthesis